MDVDGTKYYNFERMIKWLNFAYFLRKEFPFNRNDLANIKCNWGMILIPKKGIAEVIQNKISDKDTKEQLKEIVMMYQLPYEYQGHIGIINKNISLTFRYDKEYKYGDINKSIAEVCYYIEKHAEETNDFYIIYPDYLFEFMSYYVINNQWGLGAEYIDNSSVENLGFLQEEMKDII
jgi:hypothetical protein